jgi:hypothetical protein
MSRDVGSITTRQFAVTMARNSWLLSPIGIAEMCGLEEHGLQHIAREIVRIQDKAIPSGSLEEG